MLIDVIGILKILRIAERITQIDDLRDPVISVGKNRFRPPAQRAPRTNIPD